jgi:hypothetical protein
MKVKQRPTKPIAVEHMGLTSCMHDAHTQIVCILSTNNSFKANLLKKYLVSGMYEVRVFFFKHNFVSYCWVGLVKEVELTLTWW